MVIDFEKYVHAHAMRFFLINKQIDYDVYMKQNAKSSTTYQKYQTDINRLLPKLRRS